ncbi:MAG TPA: CDP-alcohol phosphatidyltransferase family protein [Phycisphaerae bacterium]|nr:CDP-alcohol phosphatidyltransferase family protein [Phycisphaerae bacterium]
MRIRRVAILPSLCTLANALCGFAAITLTMKALGSTDNAHGMGPRDVMLAGYFVLFAMIFDALDGRVARIARATSDFGGQLDTVADAVSFGVAPAFLMNRVVVESLKPSIPAGLEGLLRMTWVCAAVYLGCVLIRLARFNVENEQEEEAHMSFKGLPSPAAAGALVSMVICLAACWRQDAYQGTAAVLLWLMPFVAVGLGLLMVSNVQYLHLLNHLFRGGRPVSHLVFIILAIALGVLLRHVVLPLGFGGYVLSGPLTGLYRRWRYRGQAPPPEAEGPEEEFPSEEE